MTVECGVINDVREGGGDDDVGDGMYGDDEWNRSDTSEIEGDVDCAMCLFNSLNSVSYVCQSLYSYILYRRSFEKNHRLICYYKYTVVIKSLSHLNTNCLFSNTKIQNI